MTTATAYAGNAPADAAAWLLLSTTGIGFLLAGTIIGVVGDTDGYDVGSLDGSCVGKVVGRKEGKEVGKVVGKVVGAGVGAGVG